MKALAKVRFDILGGRNNLPEVRPAYTLARVAVSDASISPPPTTAEIAEAVIGLCGMNLSPSVNEDVLIEAIATGVASFGMVKNQNMNDRSIPWKLYAIRLGNAFTDFKSSVNRNPKANAAKAQIQSLSDVVSAAVVSRLERTDGEARTGPDMERLRSWMQSNPPKDAARQLFSDGTTYRLTPRPL